MSKPALMYCTLQHHRTQEGASMRRATKSQLIVMSLWNGTQHMQLLYKRVVGLACATCVVSYLLLYTTVGDSASCVGLLPKQNYNITSPTVLYVVTCFLSLVMRFRWIRYVASLLRKQQIWWCTYKILWVHLLEISWAHARRFQSA